MNFYLIGIDHRSAPLDIREEIQRSRKAIVGFLKIRAPSAAALLITCNRIEIYGIAGDAAGAACCIRDFLEVFPAFAGYAYIRNGEKEVLKHALYLACGIQSQLAGETQIFVQLQKWIAEESMPYDIKNLWQKALLSAEKVRALSGLDRGGFNIADVVFYDLKKRVCLSDKLKIIIAGTGRIAELAARYRMPQASMTFVSHKNYARAVLLAEVSGGKAAAFGDLAGLLAEADALISATASPHYIFRKTHFIKFSRSAERPLYAYDLAVPRDIEPDIARLKGVYLQNLADLDGVMDIFNRINRRKIDIACGLIEDSPETGVENVYACRA